MNRDLRIPAALIAASCLFVAVGAAWYSRGAGMIVAGLLLAAWTLFFVLDVGNPADRPRQ